MPDAHEFLESLTVMLAVAAVTTVVFQRLRQPVVLGYIIAGLIVGPHVPIPLVADPGVVQTLSELGVILLMFSLGLEFSLRKLMAVGPTAGLTALLQSSLMVWLGFMIGRLFGWTMLESLFAGAVIAISSTTIIAKAFEEQGVTGKLRELVVGVLIVEDLIAVLLMAVLTAIASGSGLAAGPLAATIGRLAAFLVGLVGIGLLLVPRAIRAIIRLNRRETTLVASIGICFTIALLAQAFGYSIARCVARRHAALGAHPAVPARGVRRRRACPPGAGAWRGLLAQRDEPPGARPRRRRGDPRGARRAVPPATAAHGRRLAGTDPPAVARLGSARRCPARPRERRHRTDARAVEPSRAHRRHHTGDHPDRGWSARPGRARAPARR